MSSDPEDESDLAAKDRVGRVLAGKWRLDKLLGVGGMAGVYEAPPTNNSKKVAIKVLHAPLSSSAELKRRFLREGYIANSVGHPGALSVLDDGTDEDGTVFLVMELLEGASVRQLANQKGGRIEAGELLPLVDALLDVLAAAHKNGIVHRDLKADNIFVTHEGVVKVLDFGIARILESEETRTRTGLVLGTPEYMAPEQARGRSELVDGRADLWAVGSMIFRHLTGRHVHEAETTNEVLLLAMTKPAPKLADVMPNAPAALSVLVDKALEFERDDRWATASLMQLATRDALLGVRDLEGAKTLVGTPSPFDLASAKDKDGNLAVVPVSGTAMTETSDISQVSSSAPPAPPRDKEAKTALPIIQKASTPKRSTGRRTFIVFIAIGALAGAALLNRAKLRSFGEISADHLTSESAGALLDADLPDGVSAPLVGGDFSDAGVADGDAADELDADVDEDDSGFDADEEEDEADAARPAWKRPSTSPAKRKGVPAKHRTRKKKK